VKLLLSSDHLSCQFVDRQLDGLAFLPTIIGIHCLKITYRDIHWNIRDVDANWDAVL